MTRSWQGPPVQGAAGGCSRMVDRPPAAAGAMDTTTSSVTRVTRPRARRPTPARRQPPCWPTWPAWPPIARYRTWTCRRPIVFAVLAVSAARAVPIYLTGGVIPGWQDQAIAAGWFQPSTTRAAARSPPPHHASLRCRAGRGRRPLAQHYGDGRLDQAELDERLSRAMSAKTRADLAGMPPTCLIPARPAARTAAAPAPAGEPRRHNWLRIVLDRAARRGRLRLLAGLGALFWPFAGSGAWVRPRPVAADRPAGVLLAALRPRQPGLPATDWLAARSTHRARA